jgi:putative holliday junction resolvase
MSQSESPRFETILAFDFGKRRIGVAIGQSRIGLARPLTTLTVQSPAIAMAASLALVTEWQPDALVVGSPRHADGKPHPVAKLAEAWARQLSAQCQRPACLIDETLSSHAALEASSTAARGDTKRGLDAMAAAVIAQTFLSAPEAATWL